jgi:hypothetical protein
MAARKKARARACVRERNEGGIRQEDFFHSRFLRSANFLVQNGAVRRNAPKISLAIVTSEKHAAQHHEKLRKPFSLN